ncbi:MAG: transposase [Chitinophagaceae bacterium]
MSTGYKITDQESIHFCTFTIVQWADLFTRQVYRDIVVDSFNYCIEAKGLRVHAYVFMSNHIHWMLSAAQGNLSGIIRDLKSYTAKLIFAQILEDSESRREWLVMVCKYAAGGHTHNKDFQIWSHDNHAEEIWSPKFIQQKMDYLHDNLVKKGLVPKLEHWLYSSAENYVMGK